jgi:uroporphyrinogen-III synthase
MNILLTHQPATLVGLREQLVARGHQVRHVPLIRTVFHDVDLNTISDCPWWLFTSKSAVRALLRHQRGADELARHLIAAIGEGTAQTLRDAGITASLVPQEATGMGLAQALVATNIEGPFAWPCAAASLPDLAETLQQAGRTIRPLVVYETIEVIAPSVRPGDVVVVTSPSAVNVLARSGDLDHPLVAIGPTTAHAASLWGYPCLVAAEPTETGLLRVIDEISSSTETSNQTDGLSHGH